MVTYDQYGAGGETAQVFVRDIAYNGALASYRIIPVDTQIHPIAFAMAVLPTVIDLIDKEDNHVSFNISIRVRYVKGKDADLTVDSSFTSKMRMLMSPDVKGPVDEECNILLQRAEDFDEAGSGWVYGQFMHVDVHIMQNLLVESSDSDAETDSDSDSDYDY